MLHISYMYLAVKLCKPPVTSTERSYAVVLLLVKHCLLLLQLFCEGFMLCPCFCYALLSAVSSFAIISLGKKELVALL